ALAMKSSEELAQVLAEDWEVAAAKRAKQLQDKRKTDTKPSLVRVDGKPLAPPSKKGPLRKSG
ncbi:MAG: hypothetical protein WBV79_12600, partial [Rhodomicrobium sp.]